MSYDPNQLPYGQSQPPSPYGQPPQPYGQPPTTYGQTPYYSPPPPPVSVPPRKKSRRWLWITLVVVFVIIAGAVTAFVLAITNSPAKIAVQNYYNAVEAQNYATAYSYLDIQTLTFNGQQQTASQGLYTQVAQAVDQANGKVTAYTITGVELNSSTSTGNTATITANVTRGGK